MRCAGNDGAISRTVLLLLGGLFVVLAGGYVLVGVVADALASQLPDTTEVTMFGDLGARQKDWLDAAGTSPAPAHRRALAVFDRLLQANGLRALEYKLYFAKDPLPNAFSLPGGAVAVTEGLLALVDSDIGLATVFGHELGHQQYRHSLKMLGRNVLLAGIASVMLGGQSNLAVGMALDLVERSHSRKQELEADAYGLRLVHSVYGTTQGALEFFSKIDRDPKLRGTKLLSMLSTHPYTPDRLKRLRRMAKELDRGAAEH